VTKSAVASRRRTVIVDAGPLKAAIDRGDAAHVWAVGALRRIPARFVTCEAAIAEAQHGLENDPVAVVALRRLVERLEIVPVAPSRLAAVFDEIERWAPRMDFADACAVVLARGDERAFVLTTDFRDFSAYRVPFASPEGAFHI
jgi:predicted nucleic acid-binding protein